MSAPPELTSREARRDLYMAVLVCTGVAMMELMTRDLDSANRWLAKNWPLYFVESQQEAILIAFTTRRLSK